MTKKIMNFLSDFGVQPILLAAQVVNFLILLFILKKLLYGPLLKVLNERKNRIATSLKNAEEIQAQLLKTQEDREKILTQANDEAQSIVDEAKKAGVVIVDEANQKAIQNAESIVQKAVEAGRAEVQQMVKEAEGNLLGLTLSVLKKVTGKVITKDEEKKLFEKEIRNLS